MNRHEAEDERALRVKTSDLLGPESCADTARDSVKRRQGLGEVGIPAVQGRYNQRLHLGVSRRSLQGIAERPLPCNYYVIE
jgi:hypothetical protein